MRKKSIVMLLCMMLTVLLVGCGKEAEETSELSTSGIASDVVSEEVSEPVSDEVISEEDTEPEVEIVTIDTNGVGPSEALFKYVKTLNKTVIVDYNFSESSDVSIIPNGAKYTINEDEYSIYLNIIPAAKEISEIKSDVNYLSFGVHPINEGAWCVYIETTGTDIEVAFTVIYDDGTEEDFAFYVTIGEGENISLSQEVEILNYDNFDAFMEYLKAYRQTIIADYSFLEKTEQALIPNGSHYTLQGEGEVGAVLAGEGDAPIVYDLSVISTGRTIKDITPNVDYISVTEPSDVLNICYIYIETVGTDLEVSFTVNYEDGTSEDYTIYITTVE